MSGGKKYSIRLNLFILFEKLNFLMDIIYCLVCLIKMYKFIKLHLNKFISILKKKRIILNGATKKVPKLDWFFKYLLVFFSNSFENKVGI